MHYVGENGVQKVTKVSILGDLLFLFFLKKNCILDTEIGQTKFNRKNEIMREIRTAKIPPSLSQICMLSQQ